MLEHYQIMGITPISNIKELKKAYKKLSSKYHPDKSTHPKANEIFCAINESYETLMSHMTNKNVTVDISLSLEDIYHEKKISIGGDFFIIPKGNPSKSYTVKRKNKSFTINTQIKKHKTYRLIGSDLHVNVNLCAIKAITGTAFELLHVSGKKITINVPRATQNGYSQTIKNMGMPNKDNSYGDLKIKYKIIVPQLSDKDIEKIKTLLLT